MADALTTRGLRVIQMEQLPEVLPTVDPALGAQVHAQLTGHGVEVLSGTTVNQISRADSGAAGRCRRTGGTRRGRFPRRPGPVCARWCRLQVEATGTDGSPVTRTADVVLVVVGVRPDSELAAQAGADLSHRGAIVVDRGMRTGLPDVFAAGDCVITHHRCPARPTCLLGRIQV
ncbi:MAG TPA: FAD-dependent oxidoreductase [Streptosporangiaceae bacterium]|nr:FAD-dependent oxidoreductase [Streptosporangiaceae bacterium]